MEAKVVDKLAGLITSAFGLVAALAWNDAIKAVFKSVFETPDNVIAMLSYAMVVTIIAVYVTIHIGRAAKEVKKEVK